MIFSKIDLEGGYHMYMMTNRRQHLKPRMYYMNGSSYPLVLNSGPPLMILALHSFSGKFVVYFDDILIDSLIK